MDVIKAHAVKNLCYITAEKMVPRGIVVHSTGANNPNLKRYVDAPEEVGVNQYGNHWNQSRPGGRLVCVHAFIGYDKFKNIRVAEILPLDICCWGVGKGSKGSYNYSPPYIQFEICEDGRKDRSYYRQVFDIAAEYCASLCKRFGIGVEQIVGHCEAYKKGYGSNHSDPEHWMRNFGETMDDFRNAVSVLLSAQASLEAPTVQENTELVAGDLVSIVGDAVYYTGKAIPAWVKNQRWYVRDTPKGDRVVIDRNESGTNAIRSPIHRQYLKKVGS